MRLGIISDSHDNIWNLDKALSRIDADLLIHCGDFCAPFIMDHLAGFKGEVHCVFGNIDDRKKKKKKAEEHDNITLHGDIAELDIDDKKIAIVHNHLVAEALASTGKYDIVFFGHTHQKKDEMIQETRLINPGEIMGRLGKPGYAIYDTSKDELSFIDL